MLRQEPAGSFVAYVMPVQIDLPELLGIDASDDPQQVAGWGLAASARVNDPLAANDVDDPCGRVRANIRAHKDIRGGVRSLGPSRMDARGVIGLLHK